jgi:membrane dipeptidase
LAAVAHSALRRKPETPSMMPSPPSAETIELHNSSIVIDTHVDTIQRLVDLGHDLVHANGDGFMDLERMKAGNLTAAFFAVCVDYNNLKRGTGPQRQATLLQAVVRFCEENADRIGLARTAADVRRLAAEGRLAAILSIEGAHALGDTLDPLPELWDLGVRSIAPAHFTSNSWADSSADRALHGGLSELGRHAIAEMNRLGLIVDVSHLSDAAFWHVLDASAAPVFASHSSARALHDHPRNLTDEMILALGKAGGLVGVTWFPEYVSAEFQEALEADARTIDLESLGMDRGGSGMPAIAIVMRSCGSDMHAKYDSLASRGYPMPPVSTIVDHVAHVADLVGADHVCLGSDHGAVRFDIPGFEDCSKSAVVTQALRDKGFSRDEAQKILGGNVLRLMESVIGA